MDRPLKLEKIQQQFSRFLYTDRPGREAEEWIGLFPDVHSPREIQSRLQVYRNNLLFTLIGTLRDTYPVVERIVSKEIFQRIAKDYVYSFPSVDSDLNRYGEHFAEFLRQRESDYGPSFRPYLSDLARLEWSWGECLDLTDDFALTAAEAQEKIANEDAQCSFDLRASAQVIELTYSVLEPWKLLKERQEDIHWSDKGALEKTQRLLIWKDTFQRQVHEIEDELWPVLAAISQGATLNQISEIPSVRERPLLLSECLQVMLTRGWISGPPQS